MRETTGSSHPNSGDLFTPVTPELVVLLERMRDEMGNWRLVAAAVPMRMKVLRNLRRGKGRKAVSQSLVDRLCTTTGVGSIDEFVWFTADDLVVLGIWAQPVLIQDQPKLTPEERRQRRRARESARRKQVRKMNKEIDNLRW